MAMKEQKSRKMESSTPMYPFINPLRPRNNSQIIVYHNKPYSLNQHMSSLLFCMFAWNSIHGFLSIILWCLVHYIWTILGHT